MYSDRRKPGTHLIGSQDEIDIMDLLKKIWRGRVLIISVMVLSAIVAYVALMMLPSYYRIESTIDAVRAEQMRPISPAILESKAYLVTNSVNDGKEYQVQAPDEKKIYSKVLLQVPSFSILKSFWEWKTGKVLDFGKDIPLTDDARAFKKFYKGFVLQPSNSKTPEITARQISFEYEDQKQGVTLQKEYLDYLNKYVWMDHLSTIEAIYVENLKALAVSYESRNLIEQRKLNDEILRLRESLKIAESLNIRETPFKELENVQLRILDSRDYILGTKTLSQQLEILLARQGKSLSPFVPDLRSMEIWKEQMTADLLRFKNLDHKVNMFSVVNAPSSSLDPVKPQKTLIFIAVIILSGLFGVFFVLIRSSLKNHKVTAN